MSDAQIVPMPSIEDFKEYRDRLERVSGDSDGGIDFNAEALNMIETGFPKWTSNDVPEV